MNLGLKKKNAIVCASSQGLGKAAALDLAKGRLHDWIGGSSRRRLGQNFYLTSKVFF